MLFEGDTDPTPPEGMVTVAPLECVAAVVPHMPRIIVHEVLPAPWVTSMISESIRMKNSPEGGNEAAEVMVRVVAVVVVMAAPSVDEPS